MTRFYLPPDFDEANEAWGANCGPAALSAILARPLADVRLLLGAFKGYMNARDMVAAVRAAGRDAGIAKVPQDWRGRGLVRIQIGGPWSQPGVPPAAALRHTHWIASFDAGHVFDVNFAPLRWDTWDAWAREVAEVLVAETSRATGWSIRDVVVRRGRRSAPQ